MEKGGIKGLVKKRRAAASVEDEKARKKEQMCNRSKY